MGDLLTRAYRVGQAVTGFVLYAQSVFGWLDVVPFAAFRPLMFVRSAVRAMVTFQFR
jgi:hypothetical protein